MVRSESADRTATIGRPFMDVHSAAGSVIDTSLRSSCGQKRTDAMASVLLAPRVRAHPRRGAEGVAGIVLSLVAASGCAEQPRAGVGSDGIFRITPQRPVPELRAEALAAQPPAESGQFRNVDLVELTTLDPTIKLDIRYATANNFLSTPVYTRPARTCSGPPPKRSCASTARWRARAMAC